MLKKKNIIQLCLKIAGGIANLIACGIFYRLLNKVSDKTLTGSQGNNEKVNEIISPKNSFDQLLSTPKGYRWKY